MSPFTFAYGNTTIPLHLPEALRLDWIEPRFTPAADEPLAVVTQALQNPVDDFSLASFQHVRSVAIAINDKTRPVPHDQILPPLLDILAQMGIPRQSVRLLVANGTHLPMREEEYERILPAQIYQNYTVEQHHCDDLDTLIPLGRTSRGTPILGNRTFLQAELRIVIGNIEPHHFAGFSGGAKTAAIGLAGRATINYNHAMLSEPGAEIAEYWDNPLRQDIEEIGDAMRIDCALNVVLNSDKEIVAAVFGRPRAVMEAGIPLSAPVCQVQAGGVYDLVLASVGGAPKDINFYQSQKALTHAAQFTREGGMIILAAACPEGSGSLGYEAYMQGLTTPQAVIERFRADGFQVGPHKAYQVARIASRQRIVLISDMPATLVENLLMTPAQDMDHALRIAAGYFSPTPLTGLRIAALPRATNTIRATEPRPA